MSAGDTISALKKCKGGKCVKILLKVSPSSDKRKTHPGQRNRCVVLIVGTKGVGILGETVAECRESSCPGTDLV